MKRENRRVVVYSDLDGTLLDENYHYDDVQPFLSGLAVCGVALVLCSSKTRVEIDHYRAMLGNSEPFISENGSAVYIPPAYFTLPYRYARQVGGYNLVELGMPYPLLRQRLAEAAAEAGAEVVGFGDLSAEEVALDSGLSLAEARLAKMREYDEPFRVVAGSEEEVAAALRAAGLRVTRGGRYLHVMGNTDKGKAAAILTELFRAEFSDVVTIGVGDGENDLPLLRAVDAGFIVGEGCGRVEGWRRILAYVRGLDGSP